MKKLLLSTLCMAILYMPSALQAQEVILNSSVYYAPEIGPYVETELLVLGPSISYKQLKDNTYQANVEVTLIFKDESDIVTFDKYVLTSEGGTELTTGEKSMVDKQRFVLPNGVYTLEASFKDLNNDTAGAVNQTQSIIVDYNYDQVQVSDIAFVESFRKSDEASAYNKSGIYMAPYVLNYFPDNIDKLTLYAEVYNTDKVGAQQQYVVTYSVKDYKKNEVAAQLNRFMKIESAEVVPVFATLDISSLPTGNYNLVVEVRDRENNLTAVKKRFFQRSKNLEAVSAENLAEVNTENTFVEQFDNEAIVYQLKTLYPISSPYESAMAKSLLKEGNSEKMRQFFLNFWAKRNEADPFAAWQDYDKEVKKVNEAFGSNIRYGFETDQGRVYLQYGPPNQIINSTNEPGADPYDIWQYYSFPNGQRSVKFVFHNPNLVGNDYTLIHSTAQGEIRNDDWLKVVHGSFNSKSRSTPQQDHFGGRASDFYDQ